LRPIDRFSCEETFRRFDDYLDRELTPAEVVLFEEHLAHCERCTSELKFEASVLREVRSKLDRLAAPPGLMDRISRALDDAERG
jgi:anti-sigma factor (TIGR02949 family)